MYECPPTAFKEQYDKVQEQKKRGGGGGEQEDEPMQGTSSQSLFKNKKIVKGKVNLTL